MCWNYIIDHKKTYCINIQCTCFNNKAQLHRSHPTEERRGTNSADRPQFFIITVVFWQVSDKDTCRIKLLKFNETFSHYFTTNSFTTLESVTIKMLTNLQNFISWQSKLNKTIALHFACIKQLEIETTNIKIHNDLVINVGLTQQNSFTRFNKSKGVSRNSRALDKISRPLDLSPYLKTVSSNPVRPEAVSRQT